MSWCVPAVELHEPKLLAPAPSAEGLNCLVHCRRGSVCRPSWRQPGGEFVRQIEVFSVVGGVVLALGDVHYASDLQTRRQAPLLSEATLVSEAINARAGAAHRRVLV
eukprot:1033811-Prymnesium_polylepis.1